MALGNASITQTEINRWLKKLDNTIATFSSRDQQRILRRAGNPVAKYASSIAPRSARPHKRYLNGRVVALYNPGNLRRSISVLALRKTRDAFVGPKFGGRTTATEFGKPGQPVDAYYAQMIYGSAKAFNDRILAPALSATEGQVVKEVERLAIEAIRKRAAQAGISTTL